MNEKQIVDLIGRARQQEKEAMEELLRFFKPKMIAISREYFLLGADFDDLLQESMIGLYKAIQIYDDTKNNNFNAFASLCIHRQLQNAVKLANRKKNNPLNSYIPIKYYDGSNSSDDDEIARLVIVDDTSDIEQNYIDKEMRTILVSKVKDILNEKEFVILKLFLNGISYSRIAEELNMTVKNVDNKLQAIKRKLRTIKGEM